MEGREPSEGDLHRKRLRLVFGVVRDMPNATQPELVAAVRQRMKERQITLSIRPGKVLNELRARGDILRSVDKRSPKDRRWVVSPRAEVESWLRSKVNDEL